MPEMSLKQILELVSAFGVPGIVLIIWWLSDKGYQRQMAEYRSLLEQYRQDMAKEACRHDVALAEMRQMYENNVELVKNYLRLASDLKDIVIINTQKWQEAHDKIMGNQFCPNVRLRKEAEGYQR